MSDTSLLSLAEVSAGLMGLFLVGILFYLEGGPPIGSRDGVAADRYLRASTRIVLLLYALPLVLPLAMVTFPLGWSRIGFAVMGLGLVAANVATGVEMRRQGLTVANRALLVNEVAGTLGVIAVVVLPWASGGLTPATTDLARGLVISLVMALASTCTLVMWLFDLQAQSRRPPGPPREAHAGRATPWTSHRKAGPPRNQVHLQEEQRRPPPPSGGVTRPGAGSTAEPPAGSRSMASRQGTS